MSNLQITAKDTLIADDNCYECTAYGDDYYVNEDGELVSRCGNCPYNKAESEVEE